MRLSVSSGAIPGSLADRLEPASSAGFTGMDLDDSDLAGHEGSLTRLHAMISDHGLMVCSLAHSNDLECLQGTRRRRAFDLLARQFDRMEEIGTDLLVVRSASGRDSIRDDDQAVADLADAAEQAGTRGMRIAYLGLPWSEHVQSDVHALEIVERVNSRHLGLGLNARISLVDGSKPARLRDVPGNRLFHVQLSDTHRKGTVHPRGKRHIDLLPGLGVLNLTGFVRVLARSGYSGPWTVTQKSDGNRHTDRHAMARDCYRSLVNLLDEVSRSEPDIDLGTPSLPERVHATGFEFIEFAADEASRDQLAKILSAMCFRLERHHVSKSVDLWRQGAINIVVNTEKEGFSHEAFRNHGPSVCDMGLRVGNADMTVTRARALGVPEFSQPVGAGELDIPAIRGVGGNVVHFIDEKSDLHHVWNLEFKSAAMGHSTPPAGLRRIDHLAQTMRRDEMHRWLLYYTTTFNMEKSPVVNVTDPSGTVHSQAIESPEGEVRLNLNGAIGQKTFAASFLGEAMDAGVQHVAFQTDDIRETSDRLIATGFPRLSIPDGYYEELRADFGLEVTTVDQLRKRSILYDRIGNAEYFQIYSKPIFNGFFFEIVERRPGYSGYGARNAPTRLTAQAGDRFPPGDMMKSTLPSGNG